MSLRGVALRGRMAKPKHKPVRVLKPVGDVGLCFKLTAFDPYCGVCRKSFDSNIVDDYIPSDYELNVMGREEKIVRVEDL